MNRRTFLTYGLALPAVLQFRLPDFRQTTVKRDYFHAWAAGWLECDGSIWRYPADQHLEVATLYVYGTINENPTDAYTVRELNQLINHMRVPLLTGMGRSEAYVTKQPGQDLYLYGNVAISPQVRAKGKEEYLQALMIEYAGLAADMAAHLAPCIEGKASWRTLLPKFDEDIPHCEI